MTLPAVTILIVTWNRPQEIRRVIERLKEKVYYPGPLFWHLADDTSPGSYVADIVRDFPEFNYTITPRRSGYGLNVNLGLSHIKTPYVFQIEDDQLAERRLDIDAGVFIMEQDKTVALVRYDGIEGHRMVLTLDETPKVNGRRVHFLRIDRKRSQGLNAYSNRPHLKHRRFHEVFGSYSHGFCLGSTEELFARHVLYHHRGSNDLVVLSNGIERAFTHIGKSRQLSKDDIGKVVEVAPL